MVLGSLYLGNQMIQTMEAARSNVSFPFCDCTYSLLSEHYSTFHVTPSERVFHLWPLGSFWLSRSWQRSGEARIRRVGCGDGFLNGLVTFCLMPVANILPQPHFLFLGSYLRSFGWHMCHHRISTLIGFCFRRLLVQDTHQLGGTRLGPKSRDTCSFRLCWFRSVVGPFSSGVLDQSGSIWLHPLARCLRESILTLVHGESARHRFFVLYVL